MIDDRDATERHLTDVLGALITPDLLRESVLTSDGDADWIFAAGHLRDWLAQELAPLVRVRADAPEAA